MENSEPVLYDLSDQPQDCLQKCAPGSYPDTDANTITATELVEQVDHAVHCSEDDQPVTEANDASETLGLDTDPAPPILAADSEPEQDEVELDYSAEEIPIWEDEDDEGDEEKEEKAAMDSKDPVVAKSDDELDQTAAVAEETKPADADEQGVDVTAEEAKDGSTSPMGASGQKRKRLPIRFEPPHRKSASTTAAASDAAASGDEADNTVKTSGKTRRPASAPRPAEKRAGNDENTASDRTRPASAVGSKVLQVGPPSATTAAAAPSVLPRRGAIAEIRSRRAEAARAAAATGALPGSASRVRGSTVLSGPGGSRPQPRVVPRQRGQAPRSPRRVDRGFGRESMLPPPPIRRPPPLEPHPAARMPPPMGGRMRPHDGHPLHSGPPGRPGPNSFMEPFSPNHFPMPMLPQRGPRGMLADDMPPPPPLRHTDDPASRAMDMRMNERVQSGMSPMHRRQSTMLDSDDWDMRKGGARQRSGPPGRDDGRARSVIAERRAWLAAREAEAERRAAAEREELARRDRAAREEELARRERDEREDRMRREEEERRRARAVAEQQERAWREEAERRPMQQRSRYPEPDHRLLPARHPDPQDRPVGRETRPFSAGMPWDKDRSGGHNAHSPRSSLHSAGPRDRGGDARISTRSSLPPNSSALQPHSARTAAPPASNWDYPGPPPPLLQRSMPYERSLDANAPPPPPHWSRDPSPPRLMGDSRRFHDQAEQMGMGRGMDVDGYPGQPRSAFSRDMIADDVGQWPEQRGWNGGEGGGRDRGRGRGPLGSWSLAPASADAHCPPPPPLPEPPARSNRFDRGPLPQHPSSRSRAANIDARSLKDDSRVARWHEPDPSRDVSAAGPDWKRLRLDQGIRDDRNTGNAPTEARSRASGGGLNSRSGFSSVSAGPAGGRRRQDAPPEALGAGGPREVGASDPWAGAVSQPRQGLNNNKDPGLLAVSQTTLSSLSAALLMTSQQQQQQEPQRAFPAPPAMSQSQLQSQSLMSPQTTAQQQGQPSWQQRQQQQQQHPQSARHAVQPSQLPAGFGAFSSAGGGSSANGGGRGDPEAKEWFYIDPKGSQQGPCSVVQFRGWIQTMRTTSGLAQALAQFEAAPAWSVTDTRRRPLRQLLAEYAA